MIDTFSYPSEKYVLVGKVGKAHGIKGELKLFAFSGDGQNIARQKELTLITTDSIILPVFSVSKARIGKKEVLMQLDGVSSRNQAEEFKGYGVLALKEDLPELADDEYYLHELEGLKVQTVTGENVGLVKSFFDNGSHDILVVKNDKNEYLIPLIPGMITKRDKNCLTIAPPPGLLEINNGDDAGGK